jgi:hypothetical protein
MWKAKSVAMALGSFLCALGVHGQVNFQSAAKYQVGSKPVAAATADFNSDGKLDLALLNAGSNDISILLANGDGTFQAAQNFNLGSSAPSVPVSIASGDFNDDGKPDIAVFLPANTNSPTGEVRILMGNGDGTLQSAVATKLNLPARSAGLIPSSPATAVADINGDKKADLLVNLFDSNDPTNLSLNVLLGNGDGTFGTPRIVTSGLKWGIALADFNQDRRMDLSVPVTGGSQTLLGQGNGTFQPGITVATPNGFDGSRVWIADINGDGLIDLIVQSGYSSCNADGCSDEQHLSGFLAQGTQFGPEQIIALGSGSKWCGFVCGNSSSNLIYDIAPGDFDGDGVLDLVDRRISTQCLAGQCGVTSSVLEVRIGNGDGTFSPNNGAFDPTQVLVDPGSLWIAQDLNGDQLPDLVVPDGAASNEIDVLLNAVPGFFLRGTPPMQTVHAGGSATFTINVGQQNGFSSPVAVTCSAPASAGIQCSLSSSSVTPGNSLTLTITTSPKSASTLRMDASRFLYASFLPLLGMVSLFGLDMKPIKRRITATLLFSGVIAGLLQLVACGGNSRHSISGGGSPTGTYSVSVTGTSGSLQRSTNISLLVQ